MAIQAATVVLLEIVAYPSLAEMEERVSIDSKHSHVMVTAVSLVTRLLITQCISHPCMNGGTGANERMEVSLAPQVCILPLIIVQIFLHSFIRRGVHQYLLLEWIDVSLDVNLQCRYYE